MKDGALLRQTDAFIGRGQELALLRAAFDRHERLVTLVGPPGIGKTRLAAEYVRDGSEGNAEIPRVRPCVCDLSEASDERDFWAAIFSAVGVGLPDGTARVSP